MTPIKGTLSNAIAAVTTMEIIEAFGVSYKISGGRTYILCPDPNHEDLHFGACQVDKRDNGYYCYACRKHVDKWEMVLQLNGNRKADAYEWFFRMAGLIPATENHEDPLKRVKKIIKSLEHYMNNSVVYNDICTCEKIESSYGRNIKGDYVYSELAVTNPLMELYKTDKALFQEVVIAKLDAIIARLTSQMENYQKNTDDCLYVDGVGLIANEELAATCETMLTDVQLLMASVHKL